MKRLVLTGTVLFGLCFLACNRNDDDDWHGRNYNSLMIFNDLTSHLLTPNEDERRFDKVVFDSLWQGDTLSVNEVYIELEATDITYATAGKREAFGASVYAEVAVSSLKSHIINSSVVSDQAVYTLDSVYEAGEELKDLFLYSNSYDIWGLSNPREDLSEVSRSVESHKLCLMKMDEALLQPLDQTFTIEVEFEDGSSISTTTERVLVK